MSYLAVFPSFLFFFQTEAFSFLFIVEQGCLVGNIVAFALSLWVSPNVLLNTHKVVVKDFGNEISHIIEHPVDQKCHRALVDVKDPVVSSEKQRP